MLTGHPNISQVSKRLTPTAVPSDTELRRQMFVDFCGCDRLLRHCGKHVRGLDPTAFEFPFIERLHTIDKCTIPFAGSIEVPAVRAVDKRIDDVSERDEQIEMKTLRE